MGIPNLGHNPKFFMFFLVTPPLTEIIYTFGGICFFLLFFFASFGLFGFL